MSTTKRVTTIYDLKEDRIRLLVQRLPGGSQELWLTRRFLSKLLPALLDRLEARSSLGAETATQTAKDALQRFDQAVALSKLTKQEPVFSNGSGTNAVLVTDVTLKWGKRQISLDFKHDGSIVQTVSFHEEALRQWLGILRSQYRAAKWSDNIWPTWMQSQRHSDDIARLN